jgi:hypothetical protein
MLIRLAVALSCDAVPRRLADPGPECTSAASCSPGSGAAGGGSAGSGGSIGAGIAATAAGIAAATADGCPVVIAVIAAALASSAACRVCAVDDRLAAPAARCAAACESNADTAVHDELRTAAIHTDTGSPAGGWHIDGPDTGADEPASPVPALLSPSGSMVTATGLYVPRAAKR